MSYRLKKSIAGFGIVLAISGAVYSVVIMQSVLATIFWVIVLLNGVYQLSRILKNR
jgi:hypothetical protein